MLNTLNYKVFYEELPPKVTSIAQSQYPHFGVMCFNLFLPPAFKKLSKSYTFELPTLGDDSPPSNQSIWGEDGFPTKGCVAYVCITSI